MKKNKMVEKPINTHNQELNKALFLLAKELEGNKSKDSLYAEIQEILTLKIFAKSKITFTYAEEISKELLEYLTYNWGRR